MSFDQASKEIFNPNAAWYSYFLIPRQSFYEKKSEIIGEKFFSSSGNAIWSILLKYQEIDMQIQAFTDED